MSTIRDAESLVDYAASLDCIHCGLCLHTCPTYRLTGAESSSPRGRIHLMRAVAEGTLEPDREYADELDFCLVCRNCESVCPAGVRFGEMIEHARDANVRTMPPSAGARFARWLGFGLVLRSRVLIALAALGLRALQLLRLARPVGNLLGQRGLGDLPPVRRARRLEPKAARFAGNEPVLLLEGCVMPELFGRVNVDTAESLAALGHSSRPAPGHVCCGALHAHNGDLDGARSLARSTIAAFERASDHQKVVVNSAGCGAHMKEYGRLLEDDPAWAERARSFAARVVDYSELAHASLADDRALRLAPGTLPGPATWDDPCHLCHGQGIRDEPRALLERIEGLELVPLEDSELCCGSAGIYSLLRPEDSAAVLEPKLQALRRSGARVLITANPGCQLQWESGVRRAGLDVQVMHLAEVLALALRDEPTS